MNKDAKSLLVSGDKNKIDKLIACLSDKKKTVAGHIILTKIFDSTFSTFNRVYQYSKDSVVGFENTYNGLTWIWSTSHANTLKKSDITALRKYWKKMKLGKH